MARRPAPPPSTGLPPAFLAIAVILVAAIGVIFVVSQMEPPPEEEAPAAAVNPFEGLAPEEPPPTRGGSKSPFAGGAGAADDGAASPFGSLDDPKKEQLWKDASKIGDEAMALAKAAGEAKADDDLAGFKEQGAQAKEKFQQALDLTRDWENALVEKYGATHPHVKSIQRTRNIWRNQLVALKKTVGF